MSMDWMPVHGIGISENRDDVPPFKCSVVSK